MPSFSGGSSPPWTAIGGQDFSTASGSPFLEGKYDEADDRARYELQDAFSAATRLFGIVVSSETEIKMHQANAQGGGDAFEKFHTTANREISKLIVGQTSSAEIQKSGIGDSQGTGQQEVREDIRKYDTFALGLRRVQSPSPFLALD